MDKDTKPCPVCKTTEYSKAESKGYLCKPCANARATKWNKDNPDKLRQRHIKKTYGLSHEEYLAMFEKYDGSCWICLKPETDIVPQTGAIKSLAVDHNHKTGTIRGLLCRRCNVSLGLLREDVTTLNNMLNYMDHFNE